MESSSQKSGRMSVSESLRSNWDSVKSRNPFRGLLRKPSKATLTDQNGALSEQNVPERNAVQGEGTAGDTEAFGSNGGDVKNPEDRNFQDEEVDCKKNEDRNKDCKREEEERGSRVEDEIGEGGGNENKDERAIRSDGMANEVVVPDGHLNPPLNDSLHPLPEEDESPINASSTAGSKEGEIGFASEQQHAKDGKAPSQEPQEQESSAKSFKEIRNRRNTVNNVTSQGKAGGNGLIGKRSQSMIGTDGNLASEKVDSRSVQTNEKRQSMGSLQKRSSVTSKQDLLGKTRKHSQNKTGQKQQWKNLQCTYNVAFKRGAREIEYEETVSAEYDEREKKRQAELLFWRLDMEDIMLRLRRINKTLDAHLRRLTEKDKAGQ